MVESCGRDALTRPLQRGLVPVLLVMLLGVGACAEDATPATPGAGGGGFAGGGGEVGTAGDGGMSGGSPTSGQMGGAGGAQGGVSGAPAGPQGGDSTDNSGGTGGSEPNASSGAGGDNTSGVAGMDAAGGAGMEDVMADLFVFTVAQTGLVRAHHLDPSSGALEAVAEVNLGVGGGDFFLAATSDASRVFAAYGGGVKAFSFDAGASSFDELATGTTAGAGTHVMTNADGTEVFVAHYSENALSHLHFDGAAFAPAATLTPGERSHSSRLDPKEQWLFVPCLGSNHVARYDFAGGMLDAASVVNHTLAGGPRHMTFHPSLPVAYVLSELGGTVSALSVGADGQLGAELDSELLGSGEFGTQWGSDVQVTPDGAFLYAVERNQRTLFPFVVGPDGKLDAAGAPTELGEVVRAFALSPDSGWAAVGGQDGQLRVYRIGADGNLTLAPGGLSGLGDLQATLVRAL